MLEPVLKAEVDTLVSRSPWFVPIPSALQDAYRQRGLERFARLARYGSPLLVLLFVLVNFFTLLLYGNELVGNDRTSWLICDITIGIIIAVGVSMAQFARWRVSFTRWVSTMFGVILFAKILCTQGMQQSTTAHNDIYITLIISAIGTLTIGLPVRNSLMAGIAAMSGFIVGPLLLGTSPWYFEFLIYYIAVTIIFALVAALAEHQDRMNFLQSILLEHESCEVQRLNDELAALARRDQLTGLANRRAFDESLTREWDRARREHAPVALLMLDVDHFKRYNDTYGHPAGDSCLIKVSTLLADLLRRPGDLAARYGGEEFALLLPGTDLAGASQVAKRLIAEMDAVALPHSASETAAHVTLSIGIAAGIPGDDIQAELLIDNADAALYQAKREGRHRYLGVALTTAAKMPHPDHA